MKNIRTFIALLLIVIAFASCKENKDINNDDIATVYQCSMQCEGKKVYHAQGSCPVCNMDLKAIENQSEKKIVSDEISDESIFNLTTKWNTEENKTIQLKDLKGKTLVVVMIYTTCKAACPRLVADMRSIEAKIPKENLKNLQFVLVSIDPDTDTPKRLKEFAIENQMDGDQWTFLQGTKKGVREFANVLAVKYKEISPMDFSHSNIISVFNTQGELIHQQEGLGVDNKQTILKILELIP